MTNLPQTPLGSTVCSSIMRQSSFTVVLPSKSKVVADTNPLDIFRTNRQDANISDTSSYLDLSPLYGRNQETQDSVRTFQDGKLKPDTFAEERLLGQPPGVCVMLVLYSRFHNYAAENIAAINEDGRFTMPSKDDPAYDSKLKTRDNDIFQTARLYVPFHGLQTYDIRLSII